MYCLPQSALRWTGGTTSYFRFGSQAEFQIETLPAGLLDQGRERLEFRGPRLAQQLKHRHFGVDDFNP